MAKIKQKINITESEDKKMRRQWDVQRGRWYFSVADVMAILTESVDARNYWKALKNRLKNSHNQLVMDCNQLKMTASDGKSYLVDTADKDTILKIIQIVAPHNVAPFRVWLEHVELSFSPNNAKSLKETDSKNLPKCDSDVIAKEQISTDDLDLEITIDVLENKNEIIVKTIIPGFNQTSLLISTSMNTLYIRGEVKNSSESGNLAEEDYFLKELSWGKFERIIRLESLIDVDTVEAQEYHGLVTIILKKIDLDKTRFIKVKSMEN